MKLLCWNVNGLRSIYQKGFVDVLANEEPDIVALQEIKARSQDLTEEQKQPLSYSSILNPAKKAGYSGVACLFRRAHSQPAQVSFGIGNKLFDDEGRFLICRYPGFTLYNIYFPSGTTGDARQQVKYKFLEALSEHIKLLPAEERGKLILCGDFNICHRPIDIHHPQQAEKRKLSGFLPEERAWFDSFIELGFVDAYRCLHADKPNVYTWWSFRANSRAKNLGWRIDYFLVSRALRPKIKSAAVLDKITGSDHCPIVLEVML